MMRYLENLIVNVISDDEDWLAEFLNLLTGEEATTELAHVMRDKFAANIPDCGEFWQELMLYAIAMANWEEIAKNLTDRRTLGDRDAAWIMVERRKS